MPRDGPSGADVSVLLHWSNAVVGEPSEKAEEGVEAEHDLDRRDRANAERRQPLRRGGGKRADRPGERADEAVARERPGAPRRLDRPRQHRVLERDEHAGAAAGRIDRADEGDDQEDGIVVGGCVGEPARDHQRGGREQQPAHVVSGAEEPDAQGQQRRAEQGQRRDHADVERRQAERGEIDRQQDRDEAVAEVPQRPREENAVHRPSHAVLGRKGPVKPGDCDRPGLSQV